VVVDIVPPDLRAAVDKFDADADKIIRSVASALDATAPPEIVYHYTDDNGLRGILDSGRLWLTDIFSLNDPSELIHGFSHAVGILNERAATGHPATRLFAKTVEHFGSAGGLKAAAHSARAVTIWVSGAPTLMTVVATRLALKRAN
jgi:hypothetical protein